MHLLVLCFGIMGVALGFPEPSPDLVIQVSQIIGKSRNDLPIESLEEHGGSGAAGGSDAAEGDGAAEANGCSDVTNGTVTDGQCLVFNQVKLSWSDAKDACAAKGQVLAAIQDLNGMANYVFSTFGQDYVHWWTSGSRSDAATDIHSTKGQWVWLDDSSVGAIPWSMAAGVFNGNCLSIESIYGYVGNDCTSEQYYICSVDASIN